MQSDRFTRYVIIVIIAVAVAIAVELLRRTSLVQGLELKVYDIAVKHRASTGPQDDRIALVPLPETKIPDAELSKVLHRLIDGGAAVVGVDIDREELRPPGTSEYNDFLKSHSNIIMILSGPGNPERIGERAIRPPPILGYDDTRVALCDYPLRDGGIAPGVRRGFISGPVKIEGTDGANVQEIAEFESLASMVASIYARTQKGAVKPDQKILDGLPQFKANDGPYFGATDVGYQVMLDFPSRAGYREYPIDTVFQARNEELQEWFSGKAVLVGVTEEGGDWHRTPLRQEHRGLRLHAAFTHQLIDVWTDRNYRPLGVVSNRTETLMLLAWALIGAILAAEVRKPIVHFSGLIIGISVIGIISYMAFANRNWIPSVAPVLSFSVAHVAAGMVFQVRQQRIILEMEKLFRAHMGPEQFELVWGLREEMLKKGKILGRRVEATLLMSDIKGYSKKCENLDPETLNDWLSRFRKSMIEAIRANNGMVKSFEGDSIYAVFGVHETLRSPAKNQLRIIWNALTSRFGANDSPVPPVSHRSNALLAALAMRESLGTLNQSFDADGLPTASLRVGINSGPVIAGSIGSGESLEYAIVGDSVNTAARLESHDKANMLPGEICRILASDNSLSPVFNQFNSESIGKISLPGMAKEIEVYRIISANPQVDAPTAKKLIYETDQ